MATRAKSSTGKKNTKTTAARQTGRAAGASTRSASGGSRAKSKVTWDHDEIRRWAEARGGVPACVRGTGRRGDTGVLRIDFPDGPEPSLQQISWDEWFKKFDENNLALVYQDKTASGKLSRFNKIVSRESVAGAKQSSRRQAPKTRAGGSSA